MTCSNLCMINIRKKVQVSIIVTYIEKYFRNWDSDELINSNLLTRTNVERIIIMKLTHNIACLIILYMMYKF